MHPADDQIPGGTAWSHLLPFGISIHRRPSSRTCTPSHGGFLHHSSLRFRNLHWFQSPIQTAQLLPKLRTFQGKGWVVAINITQTPGCLLCYLNFLKIHKTAWASPLSPTKARFFGSFLLNIYLLQEMVWRKDDPL